MLTSTPHKICMTYSTRWLYFWILFGLFDCFWSVMQFRIAPKELLHTQRHFLKQLVWCVYHTPRCNTDTVLCLEGSQRHRALKSAHTAYAVRKVVPRPVRMAFVEFLVSSAVFRERRVARQACPRRVNLAHIRYVTQGCFQVEQKERETHIVCVACFLST